MERKLYAYLIRATTAHPASVSYREERYNHYTHKPLPSVKHFLVFPVKAKSTAHPVPMSLYCHEWLCSPHIHITISKPPKTIGAAETSHVSMIASVKPSHAPGGVYPHRYASDALSRPSRADCDKGAVPISSGETGAA
jgi:hypothetical protein